MIPTGFRAEDSLSRRLSLSASRNLRLRKELPTGSLPTFFPKAASGNVPPVISRYQTRTLTCCGLSAGSARGALSFLPEQRQPSTEQRYHPINDEELAALVAQRGQPYSWSVEKRPRFSLAGAQNKFPVLVRNGKYLLPQGESPSSHILKFEIAEYRNVPAYETFTMLLARAVGLPVVNIQLQSINSIYYTIMERYDRFLSDDGEVLRAHQEDFCQALGYGYEKKIPGRRWTILRTVLRDASGCIERSGHGSSAFTALADFQRACGQLRRPHQKSIASLYGNRRDPTGAFLRSGMHPSHRKN